MGNFHPGRAFLRALVDGFAVGPGDFQRPRPGLALVHLRLHPEPDAPVGMLLLHAHALDQRSVGQYQAYRPPDASVRKAGAPVPAEHAMRLAQMRKAGDGVGGAPAGAALPGVEHVVDGRVKPHAQLVFPGAQKGFDIPFPGDVHVVGVAHLASVERNMRQRVQALKAQQRPAVVQYLGLQRKHGAVLVALFHSFKGFPFVFTIERIGHLARAHEVGVHRARHQRVLPFPAGLTHAPAASQIQAFHRAFPPALYFWGAMGYIVGIRNPRRRPA